MSQRESPGPQSGPKLFLSGQASARSPAESAGQSSRLSASLGELNQR